MVSANTGKDTLQLHGKTNSISVDKLQSDGEPKAKPYLLEKLQLNTSFQVNFRVAELHPIGLFVVVLIKKRKKAHPGYTQEPLVHHGHTINQPQLLIQLRYDRGQVFPISPNETYHQVPAQ